MSEWTLTQRHWRLQANQALCQSDSLKIQLGLSESIFWRKGWRQREEENVFLFFHAAHVFLSWRDSHSINSISNSYQRPQKGIKYKPGSWYRGFGTESAQERNGAWEINKRDVYFTADSKCMWEQRQTEATVHEIFTSTATNQIFKKSNAELFGFFDLQIKDPD